MRYITKHTAIKYALMLNAPSEVRIHIVGVVNRAFGKKPILDLNGLCKTLEHFSLDSSENYLTALLDYILCLKLNTVEPKTV